jgi:hypothetical protein
MLRRFAIGFVGGEGRSPFVGDERRSFVNFYGGAIQLKITNIDSDGLLSSK